MRVVTSIKNNAATDQQVAEFRDALIDMGLTLSQFCEMVAVSEGNEDPDQEDKIQQNVKRYFNRKLKVERLNRYWRYLSQMPNFEKVDRVVLTSSKTYLSRSKYSKNIMSAFDVD